MSVVPSWFSTGGHKLHVSRIPLSISDPDTFKSIFSEFGNVLFVDLRLLSGNTRQNIGKVTYEKYDEAERAIKALHNNPKYNVSVQFDHSYLIANQLPLPHYYQSRDQVPSLLSSGNVNINKSTNSISNNTRKCDSDISDSDELAKWLETSIARDNKSRLNKKVEYQKSNGSEHLERKIIQNQDTDELNCNGIKHESLDKYIDEAMTMKKQVLSPLKLTKINVVFSRNPHDFFVKLFEEEDINSLIATECNSATAPTTRVNKNAIVGVQCGVNDTWCRARVINVDYGDYFLLKLIDYHMEVRSTQDKIRLLRNTLALKPYEVLHCSMENFASIDQTWSEKDVKTFHEIVTKRDVWAIGNLVDDIYLVRLFDNKKNDVSSILTYMLDVKIVIPMHQSSINGWRSNKLIEAIVATNVSQGRMWISDNSNEVLQRLTWQLNNYCKTQQPSFDRNFQKGETVAAREVAGERFWYRAIILNVLESGYLVQYIDFGNCEVVSEVLPLPSEFENVTAMAVSLVALKFADRKYLSGIQANHDLSLKVKLIADGINLVETAIGDKKIGFNAVSFWDEIDDEQQNTCSAISTPKDDKSELPKLSVNKSVDYSLSGNSGLAKFVDEVPEQLPTAEENEAARISFFLNNCSESFESPKLAKSNEERVSRNSSTNQPQTLSFQNKAVNRSELEQLANEKPSEEKPITATLPTARENNSRSSQHSREFDLSNSFVTDKSTKTSQPEAPKKQINEIPTARENHSRLSQHSREFDLSNSFVTDKSTKTSQPEALKNQINEIPEQKNLSAEKDYLVTPICYDGEMYVQIVTDDSHNVFDEITKLNDVCDNLEFLKSLPKVSEYLCGKSNVDDCWYRCKVIKINPNNSVEVRFVDYGNTEDLELDRLTNLPAEYFQYPAVAIPIVFDDIHPKLFTSAFEILLERHSEEFCKMRIVDNSSSPFRVIVTSFDVPLKDLQSPSSSISSLSESSNNTTVDVSLTTRALQSINNDHSSFPEYYYKDAVNNELPVGEIVEVYITEIHGPESIYCWLTDSRYKDLTNIIVRLADLKCAIAKRVNSENEKYGPSEYVPKDGELCLALCSFNNDWGRAACLSPSKQDISRVLLLFVDYGQIFQVDCKNIRRMQPEFMKTPMEAVFCSLAGISEQAEYTKTDYENIKKLIKANNSYNVLVLDVKEGPERVHIIRIPSLEKEIERFRK